MERTAPAPSMSSTGGCVVCGTALDSSRCGHCGAAVRAGPYTIVRLIAQGPHGRVYLAEDELGAKVALKELLYHLVPSVQELDAFEREATLLQRLDHPHIPKFVRGFTEGSGVNTRLYLAQQFVPGQSVLEALEQKRFDEDEAFRLAGQVLEILEWLHGRRPPVVHRDLKPANLIVGPDRQVHLVDFGTARDVQGPQTHRSTLVGTIGYMPPEQLGGTVGPRSDLYALGATLVHALTGKPPEQWVGHGAGIDVSKLGLSRHLEHFLAGLLAPKPEDRFASARAALDAIFDPRKLDGAHARRRRNPRSEAFLALGAGLAIAAALTAALAMTLGKHQTPVSAPVEVLPLPPPRVEPPLAPEPPEPPLEQPKVARTAYGWETAKWEFNKSGAWLIDQTGHDHSALFPRSGYSNDFFGPVWDGSTRILVRDSKDFAFTGPFTIGFNFGREKNGDEYKKLPPASGGLPTEHLITRGDPNGRFAFDVALIGEKLRFSIMDEGGHVSVVEGKADFSSVYGNYYAIFDPETGDQSLIKLGDCQPMGFRHTTIRPALEVPDGHVHLVERFHGRMEEINLQRGIEKISSPNPKGNCGLSGDKLQTK